MTAATRKITSSFSSSQSDVAMEGNVTLSDAPWTASRVREFLSSQKCQESLADSMRQSFLRENDVLPWTTHFKKSASARISEHNDVASASNSLSFGLAAQIWFAPKIDAGVVAVLMTNRSAVLWRAGCAEAAVTDAIFALRCDVHYIKAWFRLTLALGLLLSRQWCPTTESRLRRAGEIAWRHDVSDEEDAVEWLLWWQSVIRERAESVRPFAADVTFGDHAIGRELVNARDDARMGTLLVRERPSVFVWDGQVHRDSWTASLLRSLSHAPPMMDRFAPPPAPRPLRCCVSWEDCMERIAPFTKGRVHQVILDSVPGECTDWWKEILALDPSHPVATRGSVTVVIPWVHMPGDAVGWWVVHESDPWQAHCSRFRPRLPRWVQPLVPLEVRMAWRAMERQDTFLMTLPSPRRDERRLREEIALWSEWIAGKDDQDELEQWVWRCLANAHAVKDPRVGSGKISADPWSRPVVPQSHAPIGRALCRLLSVPNHSCAPNCIVRSDPGGWLVLASAHPRPLASAHPCRISYGPTVASEQSCRDRRAILRRTHGFICQCDACCNQAKLEPASADAKRTILVCLACLHPAGVLWAFPPDRTGGVIISCIHCGTLADEQAFREQLRRLRKAKSLLADPEQLSMESHRNAVQLLRSTAVIGCHERVHALQRWVDRCAAERCGEELLRGLDWLAEDIRWDPTADVDTAPLLAWSAILAANLFPDQACERAQEAMPRLRASLGDKHPVTQQVLHISKEETQKKTGIVQ